LFPQSSSERLTVGAPQKVVGKRNQSVQVHIPLSILTGYHVNSDKPSDPSLIPMKLTWTSLGPLEGGQVTFPKPETIKVGDMSLAVFTGKVDLVVAFKVSANAPAGPGAVSGKLGYQACNNTTCYPPKSVEITVPYQVQ
jgi:thiol:disulfide interchange protein DsbD